MKKNFNFNFMRYLLSYVSLLGSSMVSLAVIWYVTLKTNSGIIIAGVTITTYLPQLLTLLIGGPLAERFPLKWIVNLSDGFIAVSTTVLAILFATGNDSIFVILFFNTLRALGTGLQLPASRSILPKLVTEDKLMRANSLSTGVWSVIQLIAPGLGGMFMKYLPMQYVLLADVLTAIIGISLLASVSVREAPKADVQTDISLKEGFAYLKQSRVLKKCVLFYFLFQFLIIPSAVLTPMLITRALGENILLLSLTETAFSVGALIISTIMAVHEFKMKHFKLLSLSSALFGLCMLLLVLSHKAFWFLLLMLVMGLGSPLYFTPLMTHIQENVDEAHTGRIFAIVEMVSTVAIPLGIAVFGTLSEVSLAASFLIPGALLIILGAVVFLLTIRERSYSDITRGI